MGNVKAIEWNKKIVHYFKIFAIIIGLKNKTNQCAVTPRLANSPSSCVTFLSPSQYYEFARRAHTLVQKFFIFKVDNYSKYPKTM